MFDIPFFYELQTKILRKKSVLKYTPRKRTDLINK